MKTKSLTKFAVVSAMFCACILPRAAFAQIVSIGYFDPADGISINSFSGTWGGLTHVVVMACSVDGSGTVSCGVSNPATQWPAVISTIHSNGKKALLNWNDLGGSSNLFGAAQSNPTTAIGNMMSIVNTYGFDGIEMDWEKTLPNGSSSVVTSFMHSLRVALGTKWLSATAFPCCAGGVWQNSVADLDRLSLMTYDMGGANSSFCWFNSSLYNPTQYPPGPNTQNDGFSTDGSVQYYEGHGWPAAKLNIGIPFYGNVHSSATIPRAPCGGVAQRNFKSMVPNYGWPNPSGLTFDSEASAAWAPISGGYIDGETQQTINAKVAYVKAKGLGGLMEFNIESDYSAGATPQHPLLGWIQSALGGTTGPSAPSITTTSPMSAGTVGTSYSQTLTSSGSTPITWSVTSGALPSGLSLSSSSGVISGMPSTAASSSFMVQAANTYGSDSRQFSLTVNPKSTSLWFNLVSKNSGKCLDVPGSSIATGVQLDQSTCNSGDNQKFESTAVHGGYEITAKNSGLQLDVQGGPSATQDRVPIIQWPYWGGSNEIWNFVPNVDGSYSITVLSSGKCMDVRGASINDGAMVQQYHCTGGANQKWNLIPVQ